MRRGDMIGCKRVVRVRTMEYREHRSRSRVRVRLECTRCERLSAWIEPWDVRPTCTCSNGRRPLLTPEQRREVARLRAEGVPVPDVVARYGVSPRTVSRIAGAEG